jgi:hypothetical protein
MKNEEVTFYERQWITKLTLFIMIPVSILFLYGCYVQLINGVKWGSRPASDEMLIISTILFLLITVVTQLSNMKTFIDSEGIHIRVYIIPFFATKKSFFWEDITFAYVRKYKPVIEYGGWGKRNGITGGNKWYKMKFSIGKVSFPQIESNNIAYNMSGNIGLQLVLNNNKRILIGTQKPEELTDVLKILGKLKSEQD